jgi:hypothetical protein
LRIERKYFWSKRAGGVCPADALVGVEESDVTPGARQLCSLMGIGQDFDQSRRDLKRVGGLVVSKERLRQIVEAEGEQVRQARDSGQLPAAWRADEAKLPDGQTRVYGGVDGVMAPTVTQVEKDKRRQQHITRRQQRGKAQLGNAKELPPPKPGSDERFKEMKIGVFYDQDKTHRHVLATEKLSKDFAPLLASHARQIGFERADQTIGLFDGAVWIYQQVCLALLCLQVILLDFYHLAEHVHATHPLLPGRRGSGPVLGARSIGGGQTLRPGGDAGGHHNAGKAGAFTDQETKPARAAELPQRASRDAGLRQGAGRRLGHRLGANGGDLQDIDATIKAARNEMGP